MIECRVLEMREKTKILKTIEYERNIEEHTRSWQRSDQTYPINIYSIYAKRIKLNVVRNCESLLFTELLSVINFCYLSYFSIVLSYFNMTRYDV